MKQQGSLLWRQMPFSRQLSLTEPGFMCIRSRSSFWGFFRNFPWVLSLFGLEFFSKCPKKPGFIFECVYTIRNPFEKSRLSGQTCFKGLLEFATLLNRVGFEVKVPYLFRAKLLPLRSREMHIFCLLHHRKVASNQILLCLSPTLLSSSNGLG